MIPLAFYSRPSKPPGGLFFGSASFPSALAAALMSQNTFKITIPDPRAARFTVFEQKRFIVNE